MTQDMTTQQADYGNWVSKWMIYVPGALALVFIGLAMLSYLFIIMAVFFIVVFTYFSYAYYKFSPAGGDIQTRIRDLVMDRLTWDGMGKALDIGCGNGALAIKLATRYRKSRVEGIDYWGGKWGYSKEACGKNAEIEGVADRISFQKASASSLPYADGYFDAAVSNFVFHEVGDAKDKKDVIKEALRVVKKGGAFAFQDLFRVQRLYGNVDDLLATIRSWGIDEVQFANTSNEVFIPGPLKLSFMVGQIGIIYGKK
jgi:ubiquinone/menaquinone biosynthesis C-methylase UbiE